MPSWTTGEDSIEVSSSGPSSPATSSSHTVAPSAASSATSLWPDPTITNRTSPAGVKMSVTAAEDTIGPKGTFS